MNRFWWRLAELVSRALEPEERDAVRGDLIEAAETGGHAFVDVLGLVARRQSAFWRNWRPWCVLMGLVLPLGVLLCLISRRDADGSAIYLWFYVNNWDSGYLSNPAFRRDLAEHAGAILPGYVTLFCWSWSSGFLIGSANRRSLPFQSVLFVSLVLFGASLGAPPRHFGRALFHRARDFSNNAAVFDLWFYRVVFPLIVQAAFVFGPAIWGMCQAQQVGSSGHRFQTLLWPGAVATLTAIAMQTGLISLPHVDRSTSYLIAQVVTYWPVAYFVAVGIAHRRHGRVIPA